MLTSIVIICKKGFSVSLTYFLLKSFFLWSISHGEYFYGIHVAKHWHKVMNNFRVVTDQLFWKWGNTFIPHVTILSLLSLDDLLEKNQHSDGQITQRNQQLPCLQLNLMASLLPCHLINSVDAIPFSYILQWI